MQVVPTLRLFSLFLSLSFFFFSHVCTQSLNTTAYPSFFSSYCRNPSPTNPYPSSCNPLNVPSLWIPPGAPSQVTISSTDLLVFVVPQETEADLEVQILGKVNFVVEGNFFGSFRASNTSALTVQQGGYFGSRESLFSDSSTLFLNNGTLFMSHVRCSSTNVAFSIKDGDAYLIMDGTIQSLSVSGTTNITSTARSVFYVNHLSVSGNTSINAPVVVEERGELDGGDSHFFALHARGDASITINGCTDIPFLALQRHATVTYNYDVYGSTPCALPDLLLADDSTMIFVGNSILNISVLEQNQFGGNAILSFVSPEGKPAATIYLPGTLEFTNRLAFQGDVDVHAGGYRSEYFLNSPIVSINGSVNFFSHFVSISEPFGFLPNFTVIVPNGGSLHLRNFILNISSPNFQWLSGGAVVVEQNSSVVDTKDLDLNGKSIIFQNWVDDQVSLNVPTVTIEPTGSLVMQNFGVYIIGNVVIRGILELPNNFLSISGNLTIENNATLAMAERMTCDKYNHLDLYNGGNIIVHGSVQLGGELHVGVNGIVPSVYNCSNFTSDIPLISSTGRITGNFEKINLSSSPSFQQLIYNKVVLSSRVIDDTVYLHAQRTSSQNHSFIFYVIGISVGLFILLAGILFFLFRRKIIYLWNKPKDYQLINIEE